jgi:hypothetical protein
VKGVPDDFIHQFKLFLFSELNLPEKIEHRDLKLRIDLVVEIFDEQPGIILAFFELEGPCPVDVEKAENHRSQKYGDKAGESEIFDETEWLRLFFVGLWGHWAAGPVQLKCVKKHHAVMSEMVDIPEWPLFGSGGASASKHVVLGIDILLNPIVSMGNILVAAFSGCYKKNYAHLCVFY